MLKLGEAKKIVNNLLKVKDVKLMKGFTLKTAAEKIIPVASASLVLHQLRDIPVFREILTGLDRVYDFASDLVAKVPIIGWASEWVTENINKPLATFLGGYAPKEGSERKAENDKTWYTETKPDLQITDTTGRPVGISYTPEVTKTTVTGAVARMMHLNVNVFQMQKMAAFTHTMSNLWENMTNGYRRSVTYTQNQVEVYIINSISYYILAKYFEKKIGFIKYDDPSYPDFRDDWSLTYNQNGAVGLQPAYLNSMLSLDNDDPKGFVHTKEVYEVISKWNRNFLLPRNLKKWIDHYFGSVFILDDDTANIKYIDVNPINLYFAYYNKDTDTYAVKERALTSFSIDDLFNELTQFFKRYATVRADLNNGAVFATSYDSKTPLLNLMDTGWITPYEAYSPNPIKSDTFKQAIINAYTTDTDFDELFKNGFIRFDYLNDQRCGDEFTALLFAGAAVPSNNIWLKDGHLAAVNVAIVLNGGETGIDIPKSWIEPSLVTDQADDIIHVSTPHVAIFKTESGEYDNVEVYANSAGDDITSYAIVPSTDTYGTYLPDDAVVTSSVARIYANSYSKYWFGEASLYFRDNDGRKLSVLDPNDPILFMNAVNSQFNELEMLCAFARNENGDVFYTTIVLTLVDGGSWFNPDDIEMTLSRYIHIIEASAAENQPPYFISGSSGFSFKSKTWNFWNKCTGTYYGDFDFNALTYWNAYEAVSDCRIDQSYLPYRDISSIYFQLGSDGMSLVPIINLYCTTEWHINAADSVTAFADMSYTPTEPWSFADELITFTTTEDSETTMTSNIYRSLAGYSAWCHNAMGYSIPVSDTTELHVVTSLDNDDRINTTMRTTSLLKEDYVPLYINRNDLPWILYWMYQSLFYIELLPYKKNK